MIKNMLLSVSDKNKKNKAVEFSNVTVTYPRTIRRGFLKKSLSQGFTAVDNLSFSIDQGDVLGIIGKNGAGKSTSLSLVAGIIGPTSGEVNTFGNTSTLLSINAGFIPTLTGRKNIYLLGLALGIRKNVIGDAMADIVDFSELGDFIDKPVETYSSGMKARLGFSTAIMLEPDILLIDEVFGVGDRNFKKKSSDAITQKLKGNSTAIIVSHSENLIKNVCTKALWIEKGKLIQFGDPKEVINNYIEYCDKPQKKLNI